MFKDSSSVTGLPFQTRSGHGAGLDQMALIPQSPSQEVSSGGAAGSSGDAGPLLGGLTLAVQAPHLAALAARLLLKLVQGLRKL